MNPSLNFIHSIRLDQRTKDKNGKYPIKLRLWNRSKRKAKLYSLNKFSDPVSFDKVINQQKTVRGENHELRIYLNKINGNADKVLNENNINSFEDFEKHMFNRSKTSKSVFFYIELKISSCESMYQYSSRDIYKGLKSTLKCFTEGVDIDIDSITPDWLNSLENWYLNRKKKSGAFYQVSGYSIYIRHLKIIINELIDLHKVMDRKCYPFGKGKYNIPTSENNKRPVAQKDLLKLLNYSSPLSHRELAVDFWMLSYFWMGINLKDILLLKWEDVHDDKIYYFRSKTFKRNKTKRKNTIFLDQRTSRLIDKYRGNGSYIFNVVNDSMSESEKYRIIKNFTRKINQHLKSVAIELSIPSGISLIWSRHTFGTEMKQKKVNPYIIQQAFGHKDVKTTENYLSDLVEEDLREIQKNIGL